MLVHFPIVLFITAVAIDGYVLRCKRNLEEHNCLVMTGFYALGLGTVFSLMAALFGDIALDLAINAGFAAAPLDKHKTFAFVVIGTFGLLTLGQGIFLWHKREINIRLGWIFIVAGIEYFCSRPTLAATLFTN